MIPTFLFPKHLHLFFQTTIPTLTLMLPLRDFRVIKGQNQLTLQKEDYLLWIWPNYLGCYKGLGSSQQKRFKAWDEVVVWWEMWVPLEDKGRSCLKTSKKKKNQKTSTEADLPRCRKGHIATARHRDFIHAGPMCRCLISSQYPHPLTSMGRWAPQLPSDTKIQGCSNPFCKMAWHLHIT